LVIYKK